MDPKERFEQKRTKAGELCDAILRKDEQGIFRLLEEINDILIGERGYYSLPEREKMDLRQLMSSEDFGVKIYLGDGGMSRLIIHKNGENISVSVSGNSSKKVKRKWEEIK